MTQPRNAASLAAMRIARQVPELPVLISFDGPVGFENVTLIGDPAALQDWHVVAGLDVEIFVSKAMSFADIVRKLSAIAAAVPKRIVLTFREGPRIDCGEMRTVPHKDGDFALFDWFPMAVWNPAHTGSKSFEGSQIIVKQLWSALSRGDIPMPFDRAMNLVVEVAQGSQSCA